MTHIFHHLRKLEMTILTDLFFFIKIGVKLKSNGIFSREEKGIGKREGEGPGLTIYE